ncbi:hypothetical protein SSX86_029021 [Deinandra increscens subsp. villosa]|uniref:Uncharacterized protein n=1 Tax=Deinandra increscens subsp. villosa TaxID=3103831 RepID=A0AAP0GL12_9ASTR
MILLKLKTKYQQEILNWEHLSNTLMALQTHPQPSVLPDLPLSLSTERSSDSTHCELAETLLLQVEAQEAFINEVSTLCDAAESICSAQEQLLKQPFIYLPIWESSPRKLITSLLCEEE